MWPKMRPGMLLTFSLLIILGAFILAAIRPCTYLDLPVVHPTERNFYGRWVLDTDRLDDSDESTVQLAEEIQFWRFRSPETVPGSFALAEEQGATWDRGRTCRYHTRVYEPGEVWLHIFCHELDSTRGFIVTFKDTNHLIARPMLLPHLHIPYVRD